MYEKTISTKIVYAGEIIDVEKKTVKLSNGKNVNRDIVRHKGASVIIPITNKNEIYMVKQFRKAIERVLIEVPAGKIDKNEDPKVCAIRELKEETGIIAKNIKRILSIYSTPGFCDEILHIYIATDLIEGEACSDEDEFLISKKIKIEELIEMIYRGEITDAKSIICILTAEKYIKGELNLKI